tara:strand:- start:144078 stop:144692 length:615 start_codon:yes stop_codon:yes gene_type:complete
MISPSHIVALVMAAGYSRRFGDQDKRRASLADGRPLLAASVAQAQQAFAQLRVVIREEDDPALLGLADDVPLIRIQQAHGGLGTSLAEAMAALGRDSQLQSIEAVAILLGDMPCLQRDTLLALQHQATRDTIVRPCHGGRPGHPVIFGRTFWPELETLNGNTGAKALIRRHASLYHEYAVQDAGTLVDIDAPADIVRINHRMKR